MVQPNMFDFQLESTRLAYCHGTILRLVVSCLLSHFGPVVFAQSHTVEQRYDISDAIQALVPQSGIQVSNPISLFQGLDSNLGPVLNSIPAEIQGQLAQINKTRQDAVSAISDVNNLLDHARETYTNGSAILDDAKRHFETAQQTLVQATDSIDKLANIEQHGLGSEQFDQLETMLQGVVSDCMTIDAQLDQFQSSFTTDPDLLVQPASNREDVRQEIRRHYEQQHSLVVFGEEINHAREQELGIALGASIAAGNPAPVEAKLKQLAIEQQKAFQNNMSAEVQQLGDSLKADLVERGLATFIERNSEDFKIDEFQVRIGIAAYNYWKYIRIDYPQINQGQFSGWGNFEKTIPLPNTYEPYLVVVMPLRTENAQPESDRGEELYLKQSDVLPKRNINKPLVSEIQVSNTRYRHVWVGIRYFDGQAWAVRGWFNIGLGEKKSVGFAIGDEAYITTMVSDSDTGNGAMLLPWLNDDVFGFRVQTDVRHKYLFRGVEAQQLSLDKDLPDGKSVSAFQRIKPQRSERTTIVEINGEMRPVRETKCLLPVSIE